MTKKTKPRTRPADAAAFLEELPASDTSASSEPGLGESPAHVDSLLEGLPIRSHESFALVLSATSVITAKADFPVALASPCAEPMVELGTRECNLLLRHLSVDKDGASAGSRQHKRPGTAEDAAGNRAAQRSRRD